MLLFWFSFGESHAVPGNCAHEFYVGITEVVYNAEERTYEVSVRLFTDDLELGIAGYTGVNPHFDTAREVPAADSLLMVYLKAHFALGETLRSPLPLRFIGRETKLDVTWIYLETPRMQPLTQVTVLNHMLMELYSDQTHIVHLNQAGRTRTELLHRRRNQCTFKP